MQISVEPGDILLGSLILSLLLALVFQAGKWIGFRRGVRSMAEGTERITKNLSEQKKGEGS